MSLFSDFLTEIGIDWEDVEPEEIAWMCNDPVFRSVAEYCARSRGWKPVKAQVDDAHFDADELGIDPENE